MSLSDETKEVISYWLRGVTKGFGVDLVDLMETWDYSKEQQRIVYRELCEISGNPDYESILWWNGLKEPEEDE